jgi:hypothetical protein
VPTWSARCAGRCSRSAGSRYAAPTLSPSPAAAPADSRRSASSHPRPGPGAGGPGVRAFANYLTDRQHLPLEPIAKLLAELLGANVSAGWWSTVQADAADRLGPVIRAVGLGLGDAPDETGTSVESTKSSPPLKGAICQR